MPLFGSCKDLKGYICIVTGASRGIGRGIALVLGEQGATVYVTGRTLEPKHGIPGSLTEVVDEIKKRGGIGIAVALDHNDETQIANLFSRVKKEQSGRLDLFVNNAFTGVSTIIADIEQNRDGFWDLRPNTTPGEYWDQFNKVGLRNAYVCCCYAAKNMIEYGAELAKQTSKCPACMIVNISSIGAVRYMFNPAYTAGKAATDKMSMDMAFELNKHRLPISVISLWPGPVATENVIAAREDKTISKIFHQDISESVELSGRVISHLMMQSKNKILGVSGSVIQTAKYARSNWIKDINGKYALPTSSIKFILMYYGWKKLAFFVPAFITIPDVLIKLNAKKFY